MTKKINKIPVWTAYSRGQKCVIAFEISNFGVKSAMRIYEKARRIVGKIKHIFTDANSCYGGAFKDIPESHTMTKKETHLIESSNSSIRDNLARFNRRTKRYTKSLEILAITMDLFINRHIFELNYKIGIVK
jgi:IS1 family transposase